MSSPTMIRHKAIGQEIGIVVSYFDRGQFSVVFQVYRGTSQVGPFALMTSSVWGDEANAVAKFDEWMEDGTSAEG